MIFDAISDAQLHGERGQLLLRASHTDKVGVEIVDVLTQLFGRVAFRVNRYEQDLVAGCTIAG